MRFTASLTEEFKNRLKWRLKDNFRRETPKEASCKYSSCQEGAKEGKPSHFHWQGGQLDTGQAAVYREGSGRERLKKTSVYQRKRTYGLLSTRKKSAEEKEKNDADPVEVRGRPWRLRLSWEFWEERVHHLIKGLTILPISLAWLQM